MKSSEHPFFSIVVPCCNVGKYVGDTIRSVREQSFADWECLLAVEESADDTLAICEAAAAEDLRIRVLSGDRTGSASTPRNRAIAVAKGVYAVLLDGDDLPAKLYFKLLYYPIVMRQVRWRDKETRK